MVVLFRTSCGIHSYPLIFLMVDLRAFFLLHDLLEEDSTMPSKL